MCQQFTDTGRFRFPGLAEETNQRQLELLLFDVGSQGFAGLVFAAQNVQQVVGNLKRNPQPVFYS